MALFSSGTDVTSWQNGSFWRLHYRSFLSRNHSILHRHQRPFLLCHHLVLHSNWSSFSLLQTHSQSKHSSHGPFFTSDPWPVSRNESKYWNVTAASKTAIKSVALLTTLIWSRCPAFMWMEVQVKWPNGRRSLSVQPGHRQWKITGPKTDHQTRPCMVSDIAAWTGVCYQNVIILQSI